MIFTYVRMVDLNNYEKKIMWFLTIGRRYTFFLVEGGKKLNETFAKLKVMKVIKEVCSWNDIFLGITVLKKSRNGMK